METRRRCGPRATTAVHPFAHPRGGGEDIDARGGGGEEQQQLPCVDNAVAPLLLHASCAQAEGGKEESVRRDCATATAEGEGSIARQSALAPLRLCLRAGRCCRLRRLRVDVLCASSQWTTPIHLLCRVTRAKAVLRSGGPTTSEDGEESWAGSAEDTATAQARRHTHSTPTRLPDTGMLSPRPARWRRVAASSTEGKGGREGERGRWSRVRTSTGQQREGGGRERGEDSQRRCPAERREEVCSCVTERAHAHSPLSSALHPPLLLSL